MGIRFITNYTAGGEGRGEGGNNDGERGGKEKKTKTQKRPYETAGHSLEHVPVVGVERRRDLERLVR